jgi:hypothetical protein
MLKAIEAAVQAGAKQCFVCLLLIENEEHLILNVTDTLQLSLHTQCLVCSACNKPIQIDSPLGIEDKRLYCEEGKELESIDNSSYFRLQIYM